jgi:glycosyltransferase involved in cell wall biosynthesis
MLAHYFPRPDNPIMGSWALYHAQGIATRSAVQVISLVPDVPDICRLLMGRKRAGKLPEHYVLDGVPVSYVRWQFFSVGFLRTMRRRFPRAFVYLGYRSVRRGLISRAKAFRPDVIFAHHTDVNGYVAMMLARELGIPYLTVDHSHDEVEDCYHFPKRMALFREVYANASFIIGVCNRMRDHMQRICPEARALSVPNASPPSEAIEGANECSSKSREEVIVFSAAAFYERKGIPFLVEVFAGVAQAYANVRLRIAGDGAEMPLVVAMIDRLDLRNRVDLLGFCPPAVVAAEMRACDIFALLGWDEPFGVVYLEAMAAGKPCVCSDDCGLIDFVKDGSEILTTRAKDVEHARIQLEKLVTNPELRAEIGIAGRDAVMSRFTPECFGRRMAEVFASSVTAPRDGLPNEVPLN